MQMRAWCLGAHSVGVIFHCFSKKQSIKKVKRASFAVGNTMHQIGLQTTLRVLSYIKYKTTPLNST